MEPIGFAIVCRGDFTHGDDDARGPCAVPLIDTIEQAETERDRIEGRPGQAMRCFEPHLIVTVYARKE